MQESLKGTNKSPRAVVQTLRPAPSPAHSLVVGRSCTPTEKDSTETAVPNPA